MASLTRLVEENLKTQNPVLDLSKVNFEDYYKEANSLLFLNLMKNCTHLNTIILNLDRPYQYSPDASSLDIPRFLSLPAFHGLKKLYLSNFDLTINSENIFTTNLSNLEELVLLNCRDTDFSFIAQLKQLKILDLSHNKNIDPSFLSQLKNLEQVNLQSCGINVLPDLQNLHKLKVLVANRNSLASIEPIKHLTNLEYLDISGNDIPDISPLSDLKRLRFLSLIDLGLENMDPIAQLSLLEELMIARNKIDILKLPTSNLRIVDASHNRIVDIENAENQHHLESLILSVNNLKNDVSLGKMVNLRELKVSTNDLSSIKALANLTNLESLDISNNDIIDIQPLENLPNLKYVRFQRNNIKVLPEKVFSNCISHLYIPSIDRVKKIKNSVVLQQNFEKAAALRDLEKVLETGTLEGSLLNDYHRIVSENYILPNPLELPTSDIILQGLDAIKAFYKNLEISKMIPFREAKVILLGEPDAGKSSLLNYFLGAAFVEEKSVTRGVRIARYNFTDEGNEYRINFWDFGGQEVQQALHQYFLTDNTLYLIILNAVTDEQPDKYLQFLDNHAPNSPFFIITNKDDLNERSKLKNNQIASTYESRWKGPEYRISVKQASLLSSCNNNQQQCDKRKNKLQELFSEIKKTFLQLPHIEQGFLSNYKNVKQVVEEMYEKEKKPYITMQEFDAFCKAQGIAEGTEKGLLSQLNFIGTVRYVDETNLSGIHILNPEWLSDGMYRIITDGGIKSTMLGKIQKKDIIRILQPQNKTDYKYKDNEIDYLVTLMCHFRVAYQDEYSKFIYLPDAFPDDLPQTLDKASFITFANHYYFSYDTEIPSYIIIRFIVKMFKYVKDNQYWNRGIVLQHHELPSNPWEALIEQNDRRIDIWLKGKDFQGFFTLIRDALRHAHEERFKAWKEMIDLGDFQVSYHDILSYLYDGDTEFKSTVIDQKTGKLKKHNINEVLGRFEVVKPKETHPNSGTIIHLENGDFINHGQFQGEQNTQTVTQSAPLTKSEPDPAIQAAIEGYKREELKKWKLYGWLWLILSLIITIAAFYLLSIDELPGISKDNWDKFLKSQTLVLITKITPTAWSLFIGKIWYDRVCDNSKQKAFLDTLEIPKELTKK